MLKNRTDRDGPFINDEGDIWVPARVGGIVVAQRIASEAAYDKCHFVNMETVEVSLHSWDEIHEFDDNLALAECELSGPDYWCTWAERCYHFRQSDD